MRTPKYLMALAVVALIAASCGASESPITAEEASADLVSADQSTDQSAECNSFDPSTVDLTSAEADHDEAEAEDEADRDEAEAEDEADHDEAEAEDEADHDDEAVPTVDEIDMAIEVGMTEFAYDCTLPEIPVGSVVALRFTNVGAVEHEAVIGDLAVQDEAEAAMLDPNAMEAHGHMAPSLSLVPGESGDLIVTFDEPGELIIGCHIPGHWDAGMHADVTTA